MKLDSKTREYLLLLLVSQLIDPILLKQVCVHLSRHTVLTFDGFSIAVSLYGVISQINSALTFCFLRPKIFPCVFARTSREQLYARKDCSNYYKAGVITMGNAFQKVVPRKLCPNDNDSCILP